MDSQPCFRGKKTLGIRQGSIWSSTRVELHVCPPAGGEKEKKKMPLLPAALATPTCGSRLYVFTLNRYLHPSVPSTISVRADAFVPRCFLERRALWSQTKDRDTYRKYSKFIWPCIGDSNEHEEGKKYTLEYHECTCVGRRCSRDYCSDVSIGKKKKKNHKNMHCTAIVFLPCWACTRRTIRPLILVKARDHHQRQQQQQQEQQARINVSSHHRGGGGAGWR